jgi:calcineurin-like phosphoesterase family protein
MEKQNQNWFTSDTHFGHENVIRYSNRPYKDKQEMDEGIIANWNSKVQPDDNVYHIGDVFFCQKARAIQILSRLNGKITLVMGNHDKSIRRDNDFQRYFHQVVDYLELTIEGQKMVLSHYPMMTWNGSGRGSWMLHGHCHGNLKYPFEAKIHDVGVDPNHYVPISFQDVKRIMDKKAISVIDHHGA